MATTNATTVLFNNTTLTAGAGDSTSSIWTLDTGYGGELFVKITNGATGPTVPAQIEVFVSPDNSNYYRRGGIYQANTGNNTITYWVFRIPRWINYLKITAGSNTVQDVTIRAEGTLGTGI